jgi:hypothetical protein
MDTVLVVTNADGAIISIYGTFQDSEAAYNWADTSDEGKRLKAKPGYELDAYTVKIPRY